MLLNYKFISSGNCLDPLQYHVLTGKGGLVKGRISFWSLRAFPPPPHPSAGSTDPEGYCVPRGRSSHFSIWREKSQFNIVEMWKEGLVFRIKI
jgi:hypothetical protein